MRTNVAGWMQKLTKLTIPPFPKRFTVKRVSFANGHVQGNDPRSGEFCESRTRAVDSRKIR